MEVPLIFPLPLEGEGEGEGENKLLITYYAINLLVNCQKGENKCPS